MIAHINGAISAARLPMRTFGDCASTSEIAGVPRCRNRRAASLKSRNACYPNAPLNNEAWPHAHRVSHHASSCYYPLASHVIAAQLRGGKSSYDIKGAPLLFISLMPLISIASKPINLCFRHFAATCSRRFIRHYDAVKPLLKRI